MFVIAIPFAFGFLHLLLFLFYPKAKETFYFAVTAFILAGGQESETYPVKFDQGKKSVDIPFESAGNIIFF